MARGVARRQTVQSTSCAAFSSFSANFEKSPSVFSFFRGKKTFFKNCSKNGLVPKKMENIFITFKGGGQTPK